MPREQTQSSGATRTFIAIELPADVKDLIAAHVERLETLVPTGIKWVGPRTSHITLAFLGNVPDNRLSTLSRVLDEVASTSPSFKLMTGRLGAFPTPRRPRVLWLGMEGDTQSMVQMQLRLQEALAAEGFPGERRDFKPHITIGRARGKGPIHLLGCAFHTHAGESQLFEVEKIVLMSSLLTPRGPIHTPLHRAPLSALSNIPPLGSDIHSCAQG